MTTTTLQPLCVLSIYGHFVKVVEAVTSYTIGDIGSDLVITDLDIDRLASDPLNVDVPVCALRLSVTRASASRRSHLCRNFRT
jgi:hypothetical protein